MAVCVVAANLAVANTGYLIVSIQPFLLAHMTIQLNKDILPDSRSTAPTMLPAVLIDIEWVTTTTPDCHRRRRRHTPATLTQALACQPQGRAPYPAIFTFGLLHVALSTV